MIKPTLWIDLKAGISGDRFAAALIGLGAPEKEMIRAIRSAGEDAGLLDVHSHLEFLPDETLAHQLHIVSLQEQEPLPMEDAPAALEKALSQAGVGGAYADFAQRVLTILRAAESHVNHSATVVPAKTVPLSIIGTRAHPTNIKPLTNPSQKTWVTGRFTSRSSRNMRRRHNL